MNKVSGRLSGSRASHRAQSPLVSTKGFDPGREVEVDLAARQIALDADFLTVAPKAMVSANRDLIVEAREHLNDALARIGA